MQYLRDPEQSLLGLILSESQCQYLIHEIKPEYFGNPNAREIFKAIQLLHHNGESVSILTVSDWLLKEKKMDIAISLSEYFDIALQAMCIPSEAKGFFNSLLESYAEREKERIKGEIQFFRDDFNKIQELLAQFKEIEDLITKKRIKNLLIGEDNEAEFHLKEVLPPALYRYLKQMCTVKYKNYPLEIPFTSLLSIIASLAGTKFTVKHRFEEHAFFWSAVALPVGAGKTPILTNLLKPLTRLQCESLEKYKSEKIEYQAHLEEIREAKKKGIVITPQPEPVFKRYSIAISTMDTAYRIIAQNTNGLLWERDELKGLFTSLNSHKGGKGEDKEVLLSLGAGARLSVARKDVDIEVEKTAISVTGGIQPTVLRRLISEDKDNDNGLWQRFVYVIHDSLQKERNLDKSIEIDNSVLTRLYSHIAVSEGASVTFSNPDYVDAIFAYLDEEQEQAAGNSFMESYYSKCSSVFLRLSLLLHIIDCHFDRIPYTTQISPKTAENAWSVLLAYISHAEKVFNPKKIKTEEQLLIDKIKNKSLEKRTINEIAKSILKYKEKGADYARYLFKLMEEAGLGTIKKLSEKNWQFVLKGEE